MHDQLAVCALHRIENRQKQLDAPGDAQLAFADVARNRDAIDIFHDEIGRTVRVATDVEQGIIPNSGHWIMEENPDATVALVTTFLRKPIQVK